MGAEVYLMTTRFVSAHEPALAPQEAALLPAMSTSNCLGRTFVQPRDESTFRPVQTAEESQNNTVARSTLMPRSSLLMPSNDCHFCPVAETAAQSAAMQTGETVTRVAETRTGSVAGRAVLSGTGVTLPGVSRMRINHRRMRRTQPDILTEYDYL